MRCKWFSGTGILLSLVLMALPCGVTMAVPAGPEDRLTAQYSYLSPTPAGLGNWFPLLAVLFAVLALVFLLLRRDYGQMAPICLGLSAASQLLSWLLFGAFTLTGAAVVLLQLAVLFQKRLPNWRPRQVPAVR